MKPTIITLSLHLSLYLALINRAGGLYGRILTEVVSTDRTQWGLYTTTEVKILPYRPTKLG